MTKKNNKLVCTAQFEKMGYYNTKLNLWVWAWAFNALAGLPSPEKNELYLSKKLLNYGLDIELSNNSKKNDFNLLKEILTNSRILISNNISLNLLVYISLYITKKDYSIIYKVKNHQYLREYLYLFNFKYY